MVVRVFLSLFTALSRVVADVHIAHPDARKFDAVILDLLVDVSNSWDLYETEMVWLVDGATEAILRSCIFESTSDEEGYTWV